MALKASRDPSARQSYRSFITLCCDAVATPTPTAAALLDISRNKKFSRDSMNDRLRMTIRSHTTWSAVLNLCVAAVTIWKKNGEMWSVDFSPISLVVFQQPSPTHGPCSSVDREKKKMKNKLGDTGRTKLYFRSPSSATDSLQSYSTRLQYYYLLFFTSFFPL